jgi:hypothetical protein
MKNRYKYLACLIILIVSCAEDNNLLRDIAQRGGYILFEETPNTRINILEIDTAEFSENIIDPNNNATSYSLTAYYNADVFENVFVANSFPTDLKLSITDLATQLGISTNDITADTTISMVATVVSSTGTYSGFTPDYVNNNSENAGGQTVNRLKLAGLNAAMEFDITFFVPPPLALRKTSFEEPVGAASGDFYFKTGLPNASGILQNNPGEPIMNYVAVGTGIDNELGFTSEFISTGDSGFESAELGVTTKLLEFDFYPDGTQGFKIEDIDGLFRMTFDTVIVPAENPKSGAQIQVFFRSTSWENGDYLHIFANVEGPGGSSLVDIVPIISGDDIEAIDGQWLIYDTGFLDGITSYEVIIETEVDFGGEDIYWDNLLIYIPEL